MKQLGKLAAYLAPISALGLLTATVAAAQPGPHGSERGAHQNAALKNPHEGMPDRPVGGRNSFTMGQAREHIERAGFRNVTGLVKDRDGLWRGQARKGGRRVQVAMDFRGDVSSH